MMKISPAIKTTLGIALTPAALAAAWATASTLGPALGRFDSTFPLLAGGAAFLLAHSVPLLTGKAKSGKRPFYVAAHELTHALAAVFSGVRVRKISVQSRDGYVVTDSTNLFISLAPYFVPLYTLAAACVYWLLCRFYPQAQLRPWFLAAAGFTLAFHLVHTADILCGPVQSDLKKAGGALFSLPLLLLLNCLGVALALKLLFPELMSARAYAVKMLAAQRSVYAHIAYAAEYLFNTAKIYIRS